jgi:hypothetical protein
MIKYGNGVTMTQVGGFFKASPEQLDAAKTGKPSATTMAMVHGMLAEAKKEKIRRDDLFKWVKANFFPRWDRKGEWSVGASHPWKSGAGRCDREKKRIIVRDWSPEITETERMVHEISHALTSLDHGKRWQQRMELAALSALRIGREDIASKIREDYNCSDRSNGRYWEE